MFKGALFLALGFFAVCFPVVAQQAKHSGAVQHRVAASALMPLDVVSNFSIYRPNVMNASNPILFHNGPVRAWSDGAQLVSGSALMQIGMAPLGLFPVTYLAPSDIGPAPIRKPGAASNSRSQMAATDGKDLPGEMISSPLNQVYYTGEVGLRLRAMERQRQRRLLAELRLGPGRQRSLPDQCRRFVRELERQLPENSRISIFEIVSRSIVKVPPKCSESLGGLESCSH